MTCLSCCIRDDGGGKMEGRVVLLAIASSLASSSSIVDHKQHENNKVRKGQQRKGRKREPHTIQKSKKYKLRVPASPPKRESRLELQSSKDSWREINFRSSCIRNIKTYQTILNPTGLIRMPSTRREALRAPMSHG